MKIMTNKKFRQRQTKAAVGGGLAVILCLAVVSGIKAMFSDNKSEDEEGSEEGSEEGPEEGSKEGPEEGSKEAAAEAAKMVEEAKAALERAKAANAVDEGFDAELLEPRNKGARQKRAA